MADFDMESGFEGQLDDLEISLGGATQMASEFGAELQRIRGAFKSAGQDISLTEQKLSAGLSRAMHDVVLNGDSLSGTLRALANSMIQTSLNAVVRPVTDHAGGVVAQGLGTAIDAFLPFAQGARFSQGRVQPFASGGIVNRPVRFPMRGGRTGLMGEAGPEAIMPLSRGADGKLGVRAASAAPVQVVMNINTPDAESFRRSQSQIAAGLGRVLGRGARNR